MLEWKQVQSEIVRRLIRLDAQNQSPKLGHDETQFLRGKIAALRELGDWNPDVKDGQERIPEPEMNFTIYGDDSSPETNPGGTA